MLKTLDAAADGAMERYSAFLMSLHGVLSGAMRSDRRDTRGFDQIRTQGSQLATTFLNTEHEIYRQDLFAAQTEADAAVQHDMLGASSPTAWDPTGDEMADWHIHELGAQAWRDINQVAHARRLYSLSGDPARAVPNFTFKDRAGRLYPSSGYVRQTARHGLVLFGVGIYALGAHALGATDVTVTHPDPTHKHFGMKVALDTIDEVLPEVFHPNSRAFLKAEPF